MFNIISRKQKISIKKKSSRPPVNIYVLPDFYMALSHLQLKWTFICLITRLIQVFKRAKHASERMSHHIFLYFAENFLLLFRKPPDKFLETNGIIIQVSSKNVLRKFMAYVICCIISLVISGMIIPISVQFPPTSWGKKHPKRFFAMMGLQDNANESPREMGSWDSDDFPIVVDSATSKTITPFFSDLFDPKPYSTNLKGIGTGRITHVGGVRWKVIDTEGNEVELRDDEAYCCRDAPYRLLCPHSWRQTMNSLRYKAGATEGDGATMMMDPGDQQGYLLSWNQGKTTVEATLDPNINLPIIQGKSNYSSYKAFAANFKAFPTIIPNDEEDYYDEQPQPKEDNNESNTNTNEAAPQAINFSWEKIPREHKNRVDDPVTHRDEALFLSWHAKLGHAPFRNIRWAAKLGILPSKLQHCRNLVCPACLYGKQKRRPWRSKGNSVNNHGLKRASHPGECVSVDQLVSGTPGLVGQTTGRLTTSRFRVATIFVDHYSDVDYVHLQESTSAEDTIEAKRCFERFSLDRGVKVQHYHADNGIFASRSFREEVQKSGQTLSFCGVGAHHQNGVAERRIQDLSDSTRASLAHAAQRNPAVTANLWPYALRHASYVRRLMPRENNSKSPEELFTKSPIRPTTKYLHPFGCPVYVLAAPLQSGLSQPKWDQRSRVGVYLGHSSQHASNVALILNPKTGFVSPQFHCVYDDLFDSPKTDKNFTTSWAELAGLREKTKSEVDGDIEPPKNYLEQPIPMNIQVHFEEEKIQSEEEDKIQSPNENHVRNQFENDVMKHPMPPTEGASLSTENARSSRSGRPIHLTRRLQESPLLPYLQSFCQLFAYTASIADADTMYLSEAMKQPDKDEFIKAMEKEIQDHTTRGHWRLTTKQEMRERGYTYKPIAAIWSFKRKRTPSGDIIKYKARLCCHGGQTVKGFHYDETYSPVVAWSTVRMLLTLSEVYGWHARQIDFVLAFPQANVKTDVYMSVPEKFRVDSNKKLVLDETAPHPSKQNGVVKLIKNVYGLKDASKTWVDHLSKGLIEFGFIQSKIDPCLFIKNSVLFCLYVDDAICLTPHKKDADKLIKDLEKKGYILTDEGPMSAYLGIQVDRLSGNRISMKQPAFIDRIINNCGLKDMRMHDTPADEILNRDENGQERKNEFHYRSIIGQLNYLAATTRPEIQFAVHQCARFCENPKMTHEKAVKRIVRYLKRTKDQGLILHVDKNKGLECFVDADFAGSFKKENPTNPKDCLSRTGFVVKFANCPIVWASKLQTTIALSTTEAEYMALSMATRELIYLMNLIEELRNYGVDLIKNQPILQCKVFEDNAGAIELAKLPKLRPRTKHMAIQYHHFRSWTVEGLDGEKPRIILGERVKENSPGGASLFPLNLRKIHHQLVNKCLSISCQSTTLGI